MAGRFFWMPQSLATWGQETEFGDGDGSSAEEIMGRRSERVLEILGANAQLALQLSPSPQTLVWQEFRLNKATVLVKAHATSSQVLSSPGPKVVGRRGGDI